MEIKKKDRNTIKIVIIVGVMLLIVNKIDMIMKFSGKLLGVFSSVFLGVFIAYFLNIVIRLLEEKLFPNPGTEKRKTIYRGLSILLSFVTLILVFVLLTSLVIPELVNAISTFTTAIPKAIDQISNFASKYSEQIPAIEEYFKSRPDLSTTITTNINAIIKYLTTNSVGVIGSVFGTLTTIVMGVIIAIYILADKEDLKNKFGRLIHRYFGKKTEQKLLYVTGIANESLRAYLIGQTLEAIILGVLCTAGLYLFRFPYAIMIGVVTGFCGLIPVLGAYIGGAIGFLMILSKSGSQALLFIVFILVLQQIEGNIIYPKVVGDSVGLPGIWVVISIIVAGGFFGLIGIFFSVSIAATVYKIICNDIHRFEKEQEAKE